MRRYHGTSRHLRSDYQSVIFLKISTSRNKTRPCGVWGNHTFLWCSLKMPIDAFTLKMKNMRCSSRISTRSDHYAFVFQTYKNKTTFVHVYRINWARRTSCLQTQDSKSKPWRSEAEHATSRSQRLPTKLSF